MTADIIRERDTDTSSGAMTALVAIIAIAIILFGFWFVAQRTGVAPNVPNTGGGTINVDLPDVGGGGGGASGGATGGSGAGM